MTIDWGVLDCEGVQEAIGFAVWRTRGIYGFASADDLVQEARVMVAQRPDLQQCVRDGVADVGLLTYRLHMDLVDLLKCREAKRHETTVYTEDRGAVSEEDGGVAEIPVLVEWRDAGDTYDARAVRALLPAVFDPDHGWGIRVENAVDADARQATPNLATGGTFWACVVDVKTAWRSAPLTSRQRQVLFLLAQGWLVHQVAQLLRISRQAVSAHRDRGEGAMVGFLNGSLPRELPAVELLVA